MPLKPSLSGKMLVPGAAAAAVRRQYKVKLLAVTVIAVVLMWASYQQTLGLGELVKVSYPGAAGTASSALLPPAADAITLQFEVCNGFTNQRIALMSGLVLAAAANRSVVLPRFLLNGMQPDGKEQITAETAETVAFGEWFDETAFANSLAAQGVQVVSGALSEAMPVSIQEFDSQSKLNALVAHLKRQKQHQHISIACPAFRLPGALMKKHKALLRAAVEGLQPSARFAAVIAARRKAIKAKAGLQAYNLLHLRVEKDWFALCKLWQKPEEGRDNCMNNTLTVGEELQKHGFKQQVPLVVVTSWPDAVVDALETSLQSIKDGNYNVVLGSELVQPGEQLTREENALVDYYLGLEAEKFIGNSVSTFTAFIILERQWLNRYSTHYNGGAIPLSIFFPLYENVGEDEES